MNGNYLLRLLPFLLVILTLTGCGKRSTPANPTESTFFEAIGETGTRGLALDIDLEGDRIYVAEKTAGIGVYDASDPTNITLIERFPVNGRAEIIDAIPELGCMIAHINAGFDDNQIYFLDDFFDGEVTFHGSGGVSEILSVMIRDSVRSQNLPMPTVEADVARILFADASSEDGIQVVHVWLDSADYGEPEFEMIYSKEERLNLTLSGKSCSGVAAIEDFNTIAVSYLDLGVAFGNISKEVEEQDGEWYSDVDTPGEARGLTYEDNHVFVADGIGGLAVINVTDIFNPELVATWKIDGLDHAIAVFVRNDRLILIDQFDGAYFLDVMDPANPVFIDVYEVREPTSAVFVEDQIVIISSLEEGLTTLELKF